MSAVPQEPAVSADPFERRYRREPDPWHFRTSPYERARYATLLAALTRRRYGEAFEPGCSVGEFTALLAPRCASIFACDISAAAVLAARRRCASHHNVGIVHDSLPEVLASKQVYDLIIFSEIGYYFDARQLCEIVDALFAHLLPGGELVASHWLGHSADHALHADQVHAILLQRLAADWVKSERHPGFRLDSWIRS